MAILAKECPLCGGKMMPPRYASYLTTVDDPGLPIMEHPGSLDQSVAVLPHIDKFLKVSRNGRGIDDKCRCHVLWNIIGVILVVDVNPFLLKRVGQVRWCPVVARDRIAFELVVPCDGAHADATDSYEINL